MFQSEEARRKEQGKQGGYRYGDEREQRMKLWWDNTGVRCVPCDGYMPCKMRIKMDEWMGCKRSMDVE